MKCHRVIKSGYLLLTLLQAGLVFSAHAATAAKIEHTEQVHYDMKTGEEDLYAVEINSDGQKIHARLAEISPTLESFSEFHFKPCLQRKNEKSAIGTLHLVSARVEESNHLLTQVEHFLKLQDLGVQITQLTPRQALLFVKQNGFMMVINTAEGINSITPCTPSSLSGQ